MEETTALKLVLVTGIIFIVLGLAVILTFGTMLGGLGIFYDIFGAIIFIFGILWTKKAYRRYKEKTSQMKALLSDKTLSIIAAALLASSLFVSSIMMYTQTSSCTVYCYYFRDRILYIEYAMLGFTVIAGLLALAPIILSRTPLAPILNEFQPMAGAMFIILIFLVLMIYPIDTMFVVSQITDANGNVVNCCYVSIDNLKAYGPPLLRVLLQVIIPPMPTFT